MQYESLDQSSEPIHPHVISLQDFHIRKIRRKTYNLAAEHALPLASLSPDDPTCFITPKKNSDTKFPLNEIRTNIQIKNHIFWPKGLVKVNQTNCNCLWNLSISSEVDKMGFFTATFLPSRIASYTTLSAPVIQTPNP